jgi:spore maturation protein CgeB
MRTLVFKDYWYHAKARLRAIPFLAAVNSTLKARQLRAGLKSLAARYKNQAEKRAFQYQEQAAIDEFRRRQLNLNPDHRPKNPGDLRIFWVGANRDQDESGFLQALRRIGTVIEFHNWKGSYGQWYWDSLGRVRVYDPAITALNDRSLISQIEIALKDGAVDLIMGQMWANYISKEALALVRGRGIPVLNISMDDRLPDNWRRAQGGVRLGAIGLAPVTDMVLTTSSETCAWYGVEGCPAIFWPLASDPAVFCPAEDSERNIDVLFIGNKYGIREGIIRELSKREVNVECYGAGWPNGPATAEHSAALFKRARIILGVGTVGHCEDVFTLKLRDFDAPMSGALYLTHRNADLIQLYHEGVEIECYATPEEAARKIHHYLAHPADLSRIAEAGHAKALLRDTWVCRLEETFSRLGLIDGFARITA